MTTFQSDIIHKILQQYNWQNECLNVNMRNKRNGGEEGEK